MKEWCFAHPWMTFFCLYAVINGTTHILHHLCHVFIRHPFYGHKEQPDA